MQSHRIEQHALDSVYYESELAELLPKLSSIQVIWLWLRLNGWSHEEISDLLGYTKQASSWTLKAIREKARQ